MKTRAFGDHPKIKAAANLDLIKQPIYYHAVCEACTAGIMGVAKEPMETNLADLFTKLLTRL